MPRRRPNSREKNRPIKSARYIEPFDCLCMVCRESCEFSKLGHRTWYWCWDCTRNRKCSQGKVAGHHRILLAIIGMDFSGMMAVTWISAFHGLNLQVANWDGYGALCQCLFMKGLRSWGPQTAATQIQENSAVEYQYLTCLNWAFAQLGVGSSPALATNVPEMAYCNLVGHGCSPSKWR